MEKIFVDSGAFIALSIKSDQHHEEAVAIYDSLAPNKAELITSNHIADETCTRLLRHTPNGHQAAIAFGKTLTYARVVTDLVEMRKPCRDEHMLVLIYSTPEIERRAWEIFIKYDTAGFSFTDCTSFAVMQILEIKKVFTFDKHYDVMGFERLI